MFAFLRVLGMKKRAFVIYGVLGMLLLGFILDHSAMIKLNRLSTVPFIRATL